MRKLVLGLLFAALLASCGEDNPLIGTWTAEEATAEFREDGSLVVHVDDRELVGTWKVENDKLVMTLTSPNGKSETVSCEYQLEENSLSISPGDERCGKTDFTRSVS